MSTIKTRTVVWHECEDSPLEDPRKCDSEMSLVLTSHLGWVLTEGCCNSISDIHYCPWCGDKLPMELQKET